MNTPTASSVTLEQARVLVALAKGGTLKAAAAALAKGHTSVLYALNTLEQALGLKLLDRSGYRLKFTAAGERVLASMEELLEAERRLFVAVHEVRSGWEPRLSIVVDGICPTVTLFEVVGRLARAGAPTRVDVITEFLSGVEQAFEEREADLMISVLPASSRALAPTGLPSFEAFLVAHKRHPLAKLRRVRTEDLAANVLLTVRGSDPRLSLPTAGLEPQSQVVLNDFAAKKTAIVAGVGFGWLPEHLIERELAKEELVRLPYEGGSAHAFHPQLCRRRGRKLGRAGQEVFAALDQRGST